MTKPNHTCGAIPAMIRGILCLIFLALPLAAQSLNRLRLEESTDLQTWRTVAVTPEMIDANGRLLLPSDSAGKFYRMQVELIQPPSLSAQPAPATVASGSNATLSVNASGTGPFTYQWYQGAVGVTTLPVGTNSASFTTPALTSTTTYWVRVSNPAGNVNSTLATVTVGSSIPADLALIPAGSFTMGRTSGDTDTDAPPVTVTVSAFYMGKNEVTKALWDEVRTWATANGYTDLATGEGKANHPVETLSWWDVIKWCNARSQKEGLIPCYTISGAVMKMGTTAPAVNWTANGYRLPTEAEWEKAARGGVSGKRFPWGTDTISHSQANYLSSSSDSYDSSGPVNNYHPTYATEFPFTSPVGSFAANGYGLNDMAGNVWEWCWDLYGAATYVNGASDPRGGASGSVRVIRGGSWDFNAFDCRAAYRGRNSPSIPISNLGFRIARSSVP
jgi:formylglycine-generating enzyme